MVLLTWRKSTHSQGQIFSATPINSVIQDGPMECLRGILLRWLHAYSDPRHSSGRGWSRLDRGHDYGPARVPDVSQPHREPVRPRLDEGLRGVPHERIAGPVWRDQGRD